MVFGADMKFDTGKAMTAAKDAAAIAPNAPGTSACDLLFINRIHYLNECLKEFE
jgi:Holliday junction resolvasome RuvABC ATP-dependent DNA helicase subunit